MNLPRNINTFLNNLPLKTMNGEDIFVAITFFLAGGGLDVAVNTRDVKGNWHKSVIGKAYNPAYLTRAKGRVHPSDRGVICLTEEGISYIQELAGEVSALATSLIIFGQGTTHSFDKFIRNIFKKATQSVDIADTYVAGSIFDNLLDEVSKKVPIRFLYGTDSGGFVIKSNRFTKEYSFQKKESKQFHDRFIIVDGRGYIVGPSLKDAADKKPATVVVLNGSDSKKLINLFSQLWK